MSRIRTAALFAAVALAAAACSTGPTLETAPTTATETPATAATTATPEAMLLSYAYEDVDVVEYRLSIDQDLEMHVDGDVPPEEGQDLPIDAVIRSVIEGPVRYETSPGPDPGTTRIRIVSELTNVTVEGTVNGEPVDGTEGLGDAGTIPPVDVTVIVDDRGAVLSVDGEALGDMTEFLGSSSGFGNLGNQQLGRPVGPAFPDEPVTVGDSWTEVTETDGPDGPIVTTATHTLVATETIGGTDVVVVESTYETEAIEIDLGELMTELFAGLAEGFEDSPGMTDEERAELEKAFDDIAFVVRIEPSTSTAVSRFSPDSGLVVSAEVDVAMTMSMFVRTPDQATGEVRSLTTDMTIRQTMAYELVTGDGA